MPAAERPCATASSTRASGHSAKVRPTSGSGWCAWHDWNGDTSLSGGAATRGLDVTNIYWVSFDPFDRQRLALWDISPDQIARIEKDREPVRALMVYSPVNGIVSAKTAVQGNRVMPSDTLYDITDLSSIWVLADLYEINVPFVKIGDPATISLSYDPGRIFKGRVSFINPNVDEKSRTVKVRIVLENPSGSLKPDMYADVVLGGQLGQGIAVPDSAVMGTGEREMVFIAKGDGLFEPREVKTGVKVRGFYEIKKGVKEGEDVVTGANFLLDSESKL